MPSIVSIIMPVYNGELFLREAIESVIHQAYSSWELIIIDDGSNDGTTDIVRSYPDTRIHYTYQDNRGQAAALNTGLDQAAGDYITTLDADDFLTVNSIKDRAHYLDQNPNDGVVYADGIYCNANGEGFLRFTEHMPSSAHGDVYDVLIVSPFYGTGASVMVRRDLLEKTQTRYDEEIVWCQDWDFYIQLAEKTTFGFIDMVSIHYRLHEGGMTTSMPRGRRLESLIRLRMKVMGSERFERTQLEAKRAFFYDFLIKDLKGRVDQQEDVFNSRQFGSLPKSTQGWLLRLTANVYLLENSELDWIRKWLLRAFSRAPQDTKTSVVLGLFCLHPGLARVAIRKNKERRGDSDGNDPFKLAAVSNGQLSK